MKLINCAEKQDTPNNSQVTLISEGSGALQRKLKNCYHELLRLPAENKLPEIGDRHF